MYNMLIILEILRNYKENLMKRKIDRNSKLPLYTQVENALMAMLEQVPYCDGEYLPGENALMEEFSVARHTIRSALQSLSDKGLITRERGRGTKKRPREKIATQITAWSSFSSEMEKQGIVPSLSIVKTQLCTAPAKICKEFEKSLDTIFPFVSKIYGYDLQNQPDLFFESYLNPDIGLAHDKEFLNKTFNKLYDYLKNAYGILPAESKETLRFGKAGSFVDTQNIFSAEILVVERTRLVYDQKGQMLEYNIGYYSADSFEFHVDSSFEDNL